MGDDSVAALSAQVADLLLAQQQQGQTIAAMSRAQEDTTQRLDQALALLHSISRDMSALRGSTRVVVDANGGGEGGGSGQSAPLLSDHMSSAEVDKYLPSGGFTVEDAAMMGASLAASLDKFLPGQGRTGTAPAPPEAETGGL